MRFMRHQRYLDTLFALRRTSSRLRIIIAAVTSLYTLAIVLWALLGRVPIYIELEGVIAPMDDPQKVIAPIGGEVIKNNIELGNAIEKGDVLLQLDDTEKQQELERINTLITTLQATQKAAEQRREQIKDDLSDLEMSQNTDKRVVRNELGEKKLAAARSRQQFQAVQELHQEGQTSEFELEQARLRMDSDELIQRAWQGRLRGASITSEERRIVERELAALTEQLLDVKGQLGVATVRRREAERDLTHYTLRAPVSGKVVRAVMNRSGSRILAGAEIAVIEPSGDLSVRATVPAARGGKIEVGQPAKLELQSFSRMRYGYLQSEVDRVIRSAEDSTVDVRLRLLSTKANDYVPTSGDTGIVSVEVEQASPFDLLLDRI